MSDQNGSDLNPISQNDPAFLKIKEALAILPTDLENTYERLSQEGKLGMGSFGGVYEGKASGKAPVAILKLLLNASPDLDKMIKFAKEIDTQIKISNEDSEFRSGHRPNFLPEVHGTGNFQVEPHTTKRFGVVMDKASGPELNVYVKKTITPNSYPGTSMRPFQSDKLNKSLWKIIGNLILGYLEMRLWGFSHGDMKLENAMLANSYSNTMEFDLINGPLGILKSGQSQERDPYIIRIVDFGMSTRMEIDIHEGDFTKGSKNLSGTALYFPPEMGICLNEKIDEKIDMKMGILREAPQVSKCELNNQVGNIGYDPWTIGVMMREFAGVDIDNNVFIDHPTKPDAEYYNENWYLKELLSLEKSPLYKKLNLQGLEIVEKAFFKKEPTERFCAKYTVVVLMGLWNGWVMIMLEMD